MTIDGGLAEVNLRPIDATRIEVRLGDKHFFDLVRNGKGLVAEYKATKRDAIQANPNDLLQKLALLLAGEGSVS